MRSETLKWMMLSVAVGLLIMLAAPAMGEKPASGEPGSAPAGGDELFPVDDFIQINPTLPNSKLDFSDDNRESCCAKDYLPAGQPITGVNTDGQTTGDRRPVSVVRSEFEKANPAYLENGMPSVIVSCERFAEMPELAAGGAPAPGLHARGVQRTLPIISYSTNVSLRRGAEYATDPAMHATGQFHVETMGGDGQITFRDVSSYSVCMARGNNVAVIANTDNGSILTYNGSDQIYLAGNNTNMLTRTGAGDDIIEIYQTGPSEGSASPSAWTGYNIYKTALSGGADTDTVVIKGSPSGTKWCHIGGYRLAGEYFYVVEFALPPSVTSGPRRQRMSIGESVEFVVIKGKKYRLNDFLAHGSPVDTVARAISAEDASPDERIPGVR